MPLPSYLYINGPSPEAYYGAGLVYFLAPRPEPMLRQPFSHAEFADSMALLLPEGAAWQRAAGTVMRALLDALAAEFGRLDERAVQLVVEADPRVTDELLPDWERQLGLPDPCAPAAATVEQRRTAVVLKLTAPGSQSRAFFIDLATRLGYAATIEEFFTEAAAIVGGIPYVGDGWAYTWRMNVDAEVEVSTLDCVDGDCTDPLRFWEVHPIECQVTRYKPAHTRVLFAYSSYVEV